MQKDGRLAGDQTPVPGMPDGVTQQQVDAQGTSYNLSAGHTMVYSLNGTPAGHRDLWDFDPKPAGQRTPKAEVETKAGDILLNKVGSGKPFWVEYGIHPK